MKKIKRGRRKIQIKNQILLSMIIISFASITILGSVIYSISKKTIEDNYKNSHSYNLQVSSNIIDIQLKSIIDLGRTVLVDDTFMDAMLSEKNEEGNIEFSSNYIKATLTRILGNIMSQDMLIEGISVVNEKGNCLFAANRNQLNSSYYNYYRTNDILLEDWIESARQSKGREVFYGENVLLPGQNNEGICLVKNIINPADNTSIGFMVVNIQRKLLDKAFGNSKEGYQTNSYMIVNVESEFPCIYFSGDDGDKQRILEDYMNGETKGNYLFSSYVNEVTGWEVINVIEKNELSKESAYVGQVAIWVAVVLVMLSFYISKIISVRISNPLNKLEKTIETVGEGGRHITEEFDDSEIGVIGDKFKRMVNNNLELHERLLTAQLNEKEAELLLLQSQINPHFLYNTLDSLYCMAIIKEEDDIAAMVLALSNTFKLNLNKGDRFITVDNEIQKMKEYMTIQNMRYNNRFELILEVDEEIRNLKIISFILQPFIENAMYHGLEPKLGSGYIKIVGKRERGLLRFTIEDNGIGIDAMEKVDNGYGIHNVRERIKLYYGDEYDIKFDSQVHVGTTVKIEIPII